MTAAGRAARHPARPGPAGAGGGGRAAEGPAAAVEAGGAALRRPQGRPPPADHGVRRDPGPHRQPRRSARWPRRGRRAARRAVRQLARRDHDRDRASCGSPRRATVLVHSKPRDEPVEVDRDHDRDKQRLLPEDDPVLVALGHHRPRGAGQAQPAGEVPTGRGVPADARHGDADALEQGHLRRPPRRTRCGSSTSAAATPT